MDETAVSSDPVIAFLLDEVVVKDWVKRTFLSILAELQHICILLTAGIIMFLKQVYMCGLSIFNTGSQIVLKRKRCKRG